MTRALAALIICAACHSTPTLDERGAAIVGGAIDLGDDAVVALSYRARACGAAPAVICTGTLIAPRAVLTAAHCVAGESPATLVVVTGSRVDGGERNEIDAIDVHPDYDGLAADLAIVTLASPLGAPPLPVRTAIDTSQIGAGVRLVGFGADDAAVTGVKRQGMARIAEVTQTTIVVAPDPALHCNADSGGPVLLAEEIAGVVAYGDTACMTSGTSTRADVHYAAFIAPALARIAASAPASRPALAANATCTACEQTEDCPRGTECVEGACAVLGIGALGASCADEAACSGAPCLAGLDEASCRCVTSTCDVADGCGCRASGPSGTLIVALTLAMLLRRRRVS